MRLRRRICRQATSGTRETLEPIPEPLIYHRGTEGTEKKLLDFRLCALCDSVVNWFIGVLG